MKAIERSTWLELIAEVEGRAPLVSSRDHGGQHWRGVAVAGAVLAETMPGIVTDTVLCFALFHDAQRENDYTDPQHGLRGAKLAFEILPRYGILFPEDMQMLWEACEQHTHAKTTANPVHAVCWDADRLNLWRVDTIPDQRFLSTDEAKKRIEWAEDLHERNTPWEDILDMYDALREGTS
jgi:uncharacterized protein